MTAPAPAVAGTASRAPAWLAVVVGLLSGGVAFAAGASLRDVLPLAVSGLAALVCGGALGTLAHLLPRTGWAFALQVVLPGGGHLLALTAGALVDLQHIEGIWTGLLHAALLVPAVLGTWAVALLGVVLAVVVLHVEPAAARGLAAIRARRHRGAPLPPRLRG